MEETAAELCNRLASLIAQNKREGLPEHQGITKEELAKAIQLLRASRVMPIKETKKKAGSVKRANMADFNLKEALAKFRAEGT